jgi:hypothetical protein
VSPRELINALEQPNKVAPLVRLGADDRQGTGEPAASLWKRLTTSDAEKTRMLVDGNGDMGLSLDARTVLTQARRRDQVTEAPAQLETIGWVESHLPSRIGVVSLGAVIARRDRLVAFQDSITRITTDEHRYARALGLASLDRPLTRRSLGDVAVASAYNRVLAKGDPFGVFDETIRTAGEAHAQPVAFAVEAAATRRIQRLLVEQVMEHGKLKDQFIGTSLDPRVQDSLLKAWERDELKEEVRQHQARLGVDDPESQRIEHVAARMFEASLLMHAIAELRPVSAGVRPEPEERWEAREVAGRVFIEEDPRDPPRTSDAEILTWQRLLERHPSVGTPAAATERSAAFAALSSLTPTA